MNGHRATSLVIASYLLLGACSKPPASPVARTNPHPIDRYEITVELVDPPADIKSISGVAHFGVRTRACLPYREKIARVTIGASYKKEFDLIPTGHNTYKGNIFLDWPINEDYYGLGVCKWELAYASAVVARENTFHQNTRLSFAELRSKEDIVGYCRTLMRDKYDFTCFAPVDEGLIQELDAISYKMKISSRKD